MREGNARFLETVVLAGHVNMPANRDFLTLAVCTQAAEKPPRMNAGEMKNNYVMCVLCTQLYSAYPRYCVVVGCSVSESRESVIECRPFEPPEERYLVKVKYKDSNVLKYRKFRDYKQCLYYLRKQHHIIRIKNFRDFSQTMTAYDCWKWGDPHMFFKFRLRSALIAIAFYVRARDYTPEKKLELIEDELKQVGLFWYIFSFSYARCGVMPSSESWSVFVLVFSALRISPNWLPWKSVFFSISAVLFPISIFA